MNKYKVIYYLSIVVFIVNLMAMIGSLIGWFTIVESKYLFWINIVLLLVFRWVERKIKFKEILKGEKL
ncbi:hypothetical protein [Streptococcus infantis]|uniref:Uncharacterized protein n=1 Tax=Streptococcus infantis X TaxID=997830 RepID=F9PF55_9STRE|nr:hypothetical protein HMPREF1124_1702 [Streptococcus infantis X]